MKKNKLINLLFKFIACTVLAAAVLTASACDFSDLFKKTYYTVTFLTDGGSKVAPQQVESGKTAVRPQDPVWEGYTFDDWYTDVACTDGNEYDFTKAVTESFSLCAKWTKNSTVDPTPDPDPDPDPNPDPDPDPAPEVPVEYTVSFVAGADAVWLDSKLSAQQVESGKKATAPDSPVKQGYVLEGWYTDSSCTADKKYNFDIEVTADIILYAKWVADAEAVSKYAVTFNSAGGSAVYAQEIKFGEKAVEPAAPILSGKQFAGWYTDAACTSGNEYNFNAAVTQDITLYAKWNAATPVTKYCTVTFTLNGGSFGENAELEAQLTESGKKAVKPADPVKENMQFGGWYTDAACTDGNEYNFNAAVEEDIILYAKWTEKSSSGGNEGEDGATEQSWLVATVGSEAAFTQVAYAAGATVNGGGLFNLVSTVAAYTSIGKVYGNFQNESHKVTYTDINGESHSPDQGVRLSVSIAAGATVENTYTVTAIKNISFRMYVVLANDSFNSNRAGSIFYSVNGGTKTIWNSGDRKDIWTVEVELKAGETLTLGVSNADAGNTANLWLFGAEAKVKV